MYLFDKLDNKCDVDIIGGRNLFTTQDVASEDEQTRATVDRTTDLTFRLRGGIIGFENEEAYRTSSMSLYRPEEIIMWGWPVVICQSTCDASR